MLWNKTWNSVSLEKIRFFQESGSSPALLDSASDFAKGGERFDQAGNLYIPKKPYRVLPKRKLRAFCRKTTVLLKGGQFSLPNAFQIKAIAVDAAYAHKVTRASGIAGFLYTDCTEYVYNVRKGEGGRYKNRHFLGFTASAGTCPAEAVWVLKHQNLYFPVEIKCPSLYTSNEIAFPSCVFKAL